MAKSSIHFRPVQGNSETHNFRRTQLDYVFTELVVNNKSWSISTIAEKQKEIENYCKTKSGKKLYKNSTPIREAVVNLYSNHSMDDLKTMADDLRDGFGINVFQIHIHRDEGKSRDELNYHAHILADWQDKDTGKMRRLGKIDMSKMQTVVANSLNMERGVLKSTAKRLEALEYKVSQEQKKLDSSQKQLDELQKKNRRRTEQEQEVEREYIQLNKEIKSFK